MKTGILLINLGTPDSPSVPDVRKYLREFLSDPRVIDIAAVGRWWLVNTVIVPFRAPKTAALYQKIWTRDGSPLMHYSQRQKDLLREKLGPGYQVELGMRYGNPSIASALDNMRRNDVSNIVVLPLFPQYASASTGTAHQVVMEHISAWPVIPPLEFINSYCNDNGFIQAFATAGRPFLAEPWDHILLSFHGLPERQLRKANPGHCLEHATCCQVLNEKNEFCYRAQCYETARKLTAALDLTGDKVSVCFQSRLGKSPWIKPYTDDILRQRAAMGDKRLLVFAPAFTSDCLETIEEIGYEYNRLFRSLGGELVQLVPSLNDSKEWIDALASLALRRRIIDK